MTDLNKIIEDLSKLTVVEAAELSKALEEKWGVTAAAPVAVAAADLSAMFSSNISKSPVFPLFLLCFFRYAHHHH